MQAGNDLYYTHDNASNNYCNAPLPAPLPPGHTPGALAWPGRGSEWPEPCAEERPAQAGGTVRLLGFQRRGGCQEPARAAARQL